MENRDIITIKIEDALSKRTECILCHLIKNDEDRFLKTFFSEWVMDSELRRDIIRSRGFCSYHSYQLLRFAIDHHEKLGLALVLEELTEEYLNSLELMLKSSRGSVSFWRQSLRSNFRKLLRKEPMLVPRYTEEMFSNLRSRRCPACKLLLESDQIHIDHLIQMLIESQDFRERFKESRLCIPHLVRSIETAFYKAEEKYPALISEILLPLQIKNLKRLRFELSEFIRKHNYQFTNEVFGPEEDVVERATLKLAGTFQLAQLRRRIS